MIIFWSVTICMLIIALAFVLVPLVRHQYHQDQVTREKHNVRIHKEHLQELQDALNAGSLSQEDFENAVRELEQQLLIDVKTGKEHQNNKISRRPVVTVVSIAVLLPLFVASYYLMQGESELIGAQPDAGPQQASGEEMHSSEEMVERLRNRLQEQPDDAEGWSMLGRSYFVMNRFDDAVAAYRKVHELVGDKAPLLADLAEVLIVANDDKFTQEALDVIALALQADPDEPKALWIAGYAALEQGNHMQALQYWERVLNQLPPDSQDARALQENIAQIKQGTALAATIDSPVAADNSASITESAAPLQSSSSIEVQVTLDTALSGKADGEDTVFIFARAAEGPRMPLAIVRKQVKDLPLKVTLDDSMAMSPEMSLSLYKQIVVGARVSKSGNAMPVSGDLQGTSSVVTVDEIAAIKVVINETLP
ncbi:MAG: c-type cytochrome biogenesis protein CcmI [Gammaproteobacteria bacterium RIFCSPLOWO2_12_47_11]|nr:MAG: c-type cytochrome biogenesis protein CcmI [Gammaproteobacteria bacterium RIFCSPLOWO2_12_47_11]